MLKRTHRTGTTLWLVVVMSAAALHASAEDASPIIMTGPDKAGPDRSWIEAKSIPSGTKMIMVSGRPDRPGPYIFRVQFPAGYRLPPHRHQDRRSVTVLTGTYWSGVGETFAQDKLTKFGPRDYYITEAGTPHFAWAETDVVIQESGIGPIGNPIQYVNPADDPRK
jgi:quercetin dioxygenase-like cupin family protein